MKNYKTLHKLQDECSGRPYLPLTEGGAVVHLVATRTLTHGHPAAVDAHLLEERRTRREPHRNVRNDLGQKIRMLLQFRQAATRGHC